MRSFRKKEIPNTRYLFSNIGTDLGGTEDVLKTHPPPEKIYIYYENINQICLWKFRICFFMLSFSDQFDKTIHFV